LKNSGALEPVTGFPNVFLFMQLKLLLFISKFGVDSTEGTQNVDY
jgi:hypothetical protein